MTLSEVIVNEDYWHRRLHAQWQCYRRSRQLNERQYHRDYCRKIIATLRGFREAYRNWKGGA